MILDENCIEPYLKGDGYCDDINNVASCEYDGGDCCGTNVKTDFCSKCECLDPAFGTTPKPCNDDNEYCPYWAGKGYCKHSYVEYMSITCKKSCNIC